MMGAEETVLVGCEILCLPFEGSDYVACPLPLEEQRVCRQRLQYQAGIREVVEWVNHNLIYIALEFHSGTPYLHLQTNEKKSAEKWQAKLKEWGIDDSNRQ